MFDVALMGRLAGSAAPTEDEIAAAREARSREFEYEDRAFESARGVIPPLPSTEQIRALISDEALLKVIEFEVTNEQVYRKRYERPIKPGGASGVTIGIGYDLGYNSTDDVRRDLAGLLSPDNIEALIGCCGLSGEAAATARQRVRDVVLPWDRALALFQRTTVPKFAQLVRTTFPNADETAGHAFGALFSLVYNRGSKLTGERRRHMKAIHDLMAARRYELVPAQFRDMCQLWAGDPAMKGVVKRRIVEAQLFEAGLTQLRARGLVVAAAPTTAFERVGGGSVVALADEKAALEHDIGLYETATRRDPAANFESLTGSIVSFGSLALRSIGAPLLQQAEQLLKDQICRGEAELRAGLRTQIDTAARQNLGALKHLLTTVLQASTFNYLPAALHERIAAYVVDNVIAPNAGQAVQFVEGGIEGLCRQWEARLAANRSQKLLESIGTAAFGPQQDVAAARSAISQLRANLIAGGGTLAPSDTQLLLDLLCDPRFVADSAGADPYALIEQIEAKLKKGPQESANVARLLDQLHDMLADARLQVQPDVVHRFLKSLRRVRRFDDLSRMADRFLTRDPKLIGVVSTLYAQGLIDSGRIVAGIEVLHAAIDQGTLPDAEAADADGILGRAHKQIYVNHVHSPGEAMALQDTLADQLRRSIACYRRRFDHNRALQTYYQGINYVAMLKRAERDRVRVDTGESADQVARGLINALEPAAAGTTDPWLLASLGEAYLAIGDLPKSAEYFARYAEHGSVGAFELNGTIRQLEQVWQLSAGVSGPGAILTGLKAALAAKENGFVSLSPAEQRQLASAATTEFQHVFEAKIDGGKFQRLYDLQRIVRCGAAVVAVQERVGHKGQTVGTGFLVRGSDFGVGLPADKSYILTNAHVLWDFDRGDGAEQLAISPKEAQVIFESMHYDGKMEVFGVSRIVWQSPSSLHDAVLVELDKPVDATVQPLELAGKDVKLEVSEDEKKGTRLAVVGHPGGGSLAVSVLGSLDEAKATLVDKGPQGNSASPVYLHYRTPTEPGNSGSPVFEIETWKVVGLHHKGFDKKAGNPKLGGKAGSNFANQGVWIESIREAVQNALRPAVASEDKPKRRSWFS